MKATGLRRARARRARGSAGLQASLTFFALALVLPVSVLSFAPNQYESTVALGFVVTTYSATRLSMLVFAGTPRILAMGFQLFVYPFLGLASLAQLSAGQFPLSAADSYSETVVVWTLLLIILGLAAYEVAGALVRMALRDRPPRQVRIDFTQTGTILVAFIGLVFVAQTVSSSGLAPFFTSRADAASLLAGVDTAQIYALQDKTDYLLRSNLTRIPTFVALMATLVKLRAGTWKHGALGRPGTAIFVAVLVAANLIVNNPLSNSRFWFGSVLLTILAIYIPWRSPGGFRFLTYSGLAVFIFLFGSLDAFRRTETTFEVTGLRETLLTNGSYSALQTALNGTVYLIDNGLAAGRQLATAVLTFIPRSVWPDKGTDTGALIDPTYNRAATLWTEFQIDFGVIGVVLGLAIVGTIAALVDRKMPVASPAAAAITVLGLGLQIIFLRGALVPAMGALYPLAFFIALTLIRLPSGGSGPASRHRSRERADVTAAHLRADEPPADVPILTGETNSRPLRASATSRNV